MRNTTQPPTHDRSLLARLRSLCPTRPLTLEEARFVAERQANALLDWFDVCDAIPLNLLDGLRRIRVVYERTPASGSTHWTGGAWLIVLKDDDAPTRNRFSLFHELKHVIDHPMRGYLYPPQTGWSVERKAERVAEYFRCMRADAQAVR